MSDEISAVRRVTIGGMVVNVALSALKAAAAEGYSYGTYRRAKETLVKQEKAARTWSTGYGENKRWVIALVSPSGTAK